MHFSTFSKYAMCNMMKEYNRTECVPMCARMAYTHLGECVVFKMQQNTFILFKLSVTKVIVIWCKPKLSEIRGGTAFDSFTFLDHPV